MLLSDWADISHLFSFMMRIYRRSVLIDIHLFCQRLWQAIFIFDVISDLIIDLVHSISLKLWLLLLAFLNAVWERLLSIVALLFDAFRPPWFWRFRAHAHHWGVPRVALTCTHLAGYHRAFHRTLVVCPLIFQMVWALIGWVRIGSVVRHLSFFLLFAAHTLVLNFTLTLGKLWRFLERNSACLVQLSDGHE